MNITAHRHPHHGNIHFQVVFTEAGLEHTLSQEEFRQLEGLKSPMDALKFLLEKVKRAPVTTEQRAHEAIPHQTVGLPTENATIAHIGDK